LKTGTMQLIRGGCMLESKRPRCILFVVFAVLMVLGRLSQISGASKLRE